MRTADAASHPVPPRSAAPRIVHVQTAGSGGGIERLVEDLAGAADADGWDVRVLFYRGDAPAGVGAARYGRLRSRGPMIGWPRALARVLRAEQPDLVHLHGPSAGSIGAWMARRAGTGPIIYTEHREHHERSLPMRMARRAAAGIPDMNVAISRAVAGALIQKAKVDRDRVRVILNGVPLAERAERPAAEEPSRLLYVANLWPRKDHATLLRAFSLLDPAYELILVGDGPLRGQLEQRARDLGIAGRVRFAGSLADPWSLTVEGISVYVHPPTDEAGGLAVMEAMMRGLPVVATATGGVPEILRDGVDGLLVPPADASALASAIERLRSDHALAARLAQHAFEVAHERLTIGACLEAYLALYRDVLTGTKDVPRNDDGR